MKYEIFSLPSGAEVLWRTRPGYYPEQFYQGRWLSDFGLGDYESDKHIAEKVFTTNNMADLPGVHAEDAKDANAYEAGRRPLTALPPVRRTFMEKVRDLFR